MQRPPAPDTSLLERRMSAGSTRSGQGRSSRGSTEHEYAVFLSFRGSDTRKGVANHPHQTVTFGGVFHSQKMCFGQKDVEAGQQALRDVSFLKGWESEKIANGHQGEFVRIVVETFVGIDDHMKKIMGLLDTVSNGTRTIGIYGMGGIGKITFAFGEFALQETMDDPSR